MKPGRQNRQRSLDKLFALKNPSATDPEEMAHWCKYLCVLVSGFIEEVVVEWLEDYARGRSPKPVALFVSKQLYYFQNPEHKKILDQVRAFDGNWANSLEALDDRYKSSINSIVHNRHRIVHGQSCTVSFRQLNEWYEDVKEFLDEFEQVVR